MIDAIEIMLELIGDMVARFIARPMFRLLG